MARSLKSIAGALGVTLGNAPDKIGDRTQRTFRFGITTYYTESSRILRQVRIFLRIFLYITLKWSDRKKFSSLYYGKRVMPISVFCDEPSPTDLFKVFSLCDCQMNFISPTSSHD